MPGKTHRVIGAIAALALVTVPVAAFGQGTEEQQQACTPDAVKLCSDTIPDIPKTTACMKAHFSQLAPRCQAAFADATGSKTKAAERKSEAPRAKVATRAEHRMPERRGPERPEREARAPMPRGERVARAPASRDDEREIMRQPRETTDTSEALPPRAEGYPPYPAPDAVGPRAQIANACRAGLIDSFTCSTTVPALLGGPSF